jgi:hypothetical protein
LVVLEFNGQAVIPVGSKTSKELLLSCLLDEILSLLKLGRNNGKESVDQAESERSESHDITAQSEALCVVLDSFSGFGVVFLICPCSCNGSSDNRSKTAADAIGTVIYA